MYKVDTRLTIIYDSPYYKAIFEVEDTHNTYKVASVVLGTSSPKLVLIQQLLLGKYYTLNFISQDKSCGSLSPRRTNPKRQQRLVKKLMAKTDCSTQAQEAMRYQHELQREHKKKMKSSAIRQQKLDHFVQKQLKKLEKHKGH